MKTKILKYLFLLLIFPYSTLLGLDPQLIEGTWYRTYGIYRPWTDDNQGTFSYYEEELIFHPNNMVYIYESNTDKPKGKSMYTFVKRDGQDFIVFHNPNQDPNDDLIQQKQGFFITLTLDKEKHDILTLSTVKERKKNKRSKGIQYKKLKETNKEIKFVVPQNKT